MSHFPAPDVPHAPVPPGYGFPAPGSGEPFDGAADPRDPIRPLYGASFPQAIRRFFVGYAQFSGRASRSEFWYSRLFLALVSLVCLVLLFSGLIIATDWDAQTVTSHPDGTTSVSNGRIDFDAHPIGQVLFATALVLFGLANLAAIIPTLSITWRRLHDANLSGGFWFLGFVPFGGLVLLILTLLPPKPPGRRFDRPRIGS